jgi:hypothetical protein
MARGKINANIERQLREVGAEFIEAHEEAAVVIRQAASAGMSAEAISQASGLSLETVCAFLR